MYTGHFAAALALKARVPRAPTVWLLVGAGVLDLLFAPFVLLGIERATVTPGVSPGFSLDYIDWSHSLVMSLVWSVGFGLLFRRRGAVVAATLGFAVFSHFLLDLFMHPPDLALWPGSSVHLGLGLWRALPTGWWFVELGFVAVAFAYYVARSRPGTAFGGRPGLIAATLVVLHLFNSPWVPR
jgi:hypothetical protein